MHQNNYALTQTSGGLVATVILGSITIRVVR